NAWLLARAPGSSRGVLLFKREDAGGGPHWGQKDLHAPIFSEAATSALGIDQVEPLGGGAQSLTVRPNGVWIDGRLRTGGEIENFTLFFDPGVARVTGSWCDALDLDGAPVCAHPLGARFSESELI